MPEVRLSTRVSFRDWTKLPNEAIFAANPNKIQPLASSQDEAIFRSPRSLMQALREIPYPALTIGIRCATGGSAGKSVYGVF